MRRIMASIFLVIVIFSTSACAIFAEVETNIEQYGTFFEKEGSNSEYYVFPRNIPNEATDISYRCSWNEMDLFNPLVQIYLEYKLDNEAYKKEVERIKEIKGEVYSILYDEQNFVYPAYVAMDGTAMSYEYVLMDEEDNKLIYIYLRG